MSVRWPTPNVPADTAGGAVVVVVVLVGSGTLDDGVVGRARVAVAPPPHAARIATMAIVVTASVGRLGRPGRVPALIRTETCPMTTAPRSGWLVAKNTTATTTSATAAAISAMVRGLMRMYAL
jgi:hypothetical protein